MRINYRLQPKKIGYTLGAIAVVLVIFSLIGEYLFETAFADMDENPLLLVLDLFSVNLEDSIPTWFSVLILFIASVLLSVIALGKWQSKDRYRLHWAGLAGVFLYLSMDEGAVIHEILADALQAEFDTSHYLYFGWQIVAIPLVVIFGLLYLRFVFQLPARIRNLFILSAVIYVGGAIGVESISANQYYIDDGVSLTYLVIATVEEFFEMMGIIIFIYSLLIYIDQMNYVVMLTTDTVEDTELADAPVTTLPTDPVDEATPQENPLLRRLNPLVWIIALLLITNVAMLMWIVSDEPASTTTETTTPALFYTPINDQLNANNVAVVQLADIFNFENPMSRQIATALLGLFDEVFVVSLPENDTSVVFAGDVLPFDRDSLTELLHANGDVQFIIFDTMTVQAIAGATP